MARPVLVYTIRKPGETSEKCAGRFKQVWQRARIKQKWQDLRYRKRDSNNPKKNKSLARAKAIVGARYRAENARKLYYQ